jgi:hypothetical protein
MESAYINNGTVIGVREGDWSGKPGYILLADDERVIQGMGFDASKSPRFFLKPRPQAALKWTAFQFLLRFTEQEREVFRVAALTDGKVADFMQLCGAASEVEANHPLTVAGMAYLVAEGHLTQARADEVLGA